MNRCFDTPAPRPAPDHYRAVNYFKLFGEVVEMDSLIMTEAEWVASLYHLDPNWQVVRRLGHVFAVRIIA